MEMEQGWMERKWNENKGGRKGNGMRTRAEEKEME